MICAPSTATSGVRHERRGSPSTRTVHAPQPPCWQPAFGLSTSSSSRSTKRSGVSGALSTSRGMPLTVRFMRASSSGEGTADEHRQRPLPVPRRGERVVVEGDVAERGLPGRLGVGGSGLGGREASAPPADARRGEADRPVFRRARRRPRARCSRACAAGRARRTRRRRAPRTTRPGRDGVARFGRKSSSGSVAIPPAPAERTVAPSASSAPWRSPRGASGPSPAQRLPPTVPWARISKSATFAAHGPSGAASPTRSETGVVAPTVTVEPSREIPARPARCSSSAFDRLQAAVREFRQDDRAAPDHRDVRPVAVERHGLVGGGGKQNLGSRSHGNPFTRMTGREW